MVLAENRSERFEKRGNGGDDVHHVGSATHRPHTLESLGLGTVGFHFISARTLEPEGAIMRAPCTGNHEKLLFFN
jgi:hypothetical protein